MSEVQFFIDREGNTVGPLSAEQLRLMYNLGEINDATIVSSEGWTRWRTIAEISPELWEDEDDPEPCCPDAATEFQPGSNAPRQRGRPKLGNNPLYALGCLGCMIAIPVMLVYPISGIGILLVAAVLCSVASSLHSDSTRE